MWLIGRLRFDRLTIALLAFLPCLSVAILAAPQDSQGPSNDQAGSPISVRKPPVHAVPIQVNVDLVLVNVTVTDSYDRIVTGLEQSNFHVFDDKVEQQIASFSTEDAPISVGMIFDSSGSMADKIGKSKEAVAQFFKTSNPQDEFMLINFNDRLKLVSDFTSKFDNLESGLLSVKAEGRTALLDAIYLGLDAMKHATTNHCCPK
jgi:Ca-activated chloride channel homolog